MRATCPARLILQVQSPQMSAKNFTWNARNMKHGQSLHYPSDVRKYGPIIRYKRYTFNIYKMLTYLPNRLTDPPPSKTPSKPLPCVHTRFASHMFTLASHFLACCPRVSRSRSIL
jgi:hypothetical protein